MKKTLILAFLCCLCSTMWAQTRVTGRVVSGEDGQPLSFASIALKGSNTVAITDDNGRYTINVTGANPILVFSTIGYVTVEVPVGNRTVIDVTLNPDAVSLDEVLVTAYGSSTRKSFTGSAAQISGEQLVQRPISSAGQGLSGLTSGIMIAATAGQPGSNPTIRIRGTGSYSATNDPLYVLDGAPYSGNINDIAPEDIASITVLKDAASSALYGNRAANGVIIITTKRGKAGERTNIRVTIKQGTTDRGLPEQKMLNHKDWMELMWETYRNGLMDANPKLTMEEASIRASSAPKNASGTYTDGLISKILYNPYNVPADQMVGTDGKLNPNAKLKWADDLDWFGALSRMASFSEYSISGTGGTDKANYAASATFLDNKGYIMKTKFNRMTARAAADFKPVNWFKAGVTVSATVRNESFSSADGGTSYVNPFYFARNIAPIYPIYVHNQETGEYLYDDAGNKYWDWGGRRDLGSPSRPYSNGRHIVAEMTYNMDDQRTNSINGNVYAEISPIKGLMFKITSSPNLRAILSKGYQNNIVGDGAPAGRASRTNTMYSTWNNNQIISYNGSFGKHDYSILVGHESEQYEYNYLYGFRQSQVMEGNSELVNFTTTNSCTSYTNTRRSEGYLANLTYSYNNKYNLSAYYRRDGSSRFHKSSRWGNFWGFGAAWRLENESFIQPVKWIDQLKLRASYGVTGNDDVGLYPYMALYSIGYPNASAAGSYQSAQANFDLKWESNYMLDVALEFGFMRWLAGSVEFYNRITDDLLFSVPLPLSSGAASIGGTTASITKNIGKFRNWGVELQLDMDIIKKRDLSWRVTVNASTNKTLVVRLPDHLRETGLISGTIKMEEGKDRYNYWVREWMGVDPADGKALYRLDTKNVPYSPTNAEHRIIGADTLTLNVNGARYFAPNKSPQPKAYGSFNTNFRWKKFSAQLIFMWSFGGTITDGTYSNFATYDTSYGNSKHADLLKRWRKPGDITDIPRASDYNVTYLNAGSTNRWFISGSYINLNTATISYQLPTTFNGKRLVSDARIYITGDNLFQVSARYGMNAAQNLTGTTSNVYSPGRTITLGLNFNL